MAASTAVGLGLASTAYSLYQGAKRKKPVVPVLPTMPSARDEINVQSAAARQVQLAQRKKTGRRDTILTSPQGVVGAPAPGKQTLLGR